jgi:hypothetical protein
LSRLRRLSTVVGVGAVLAASCIVAGQVLSGPDCGDPRNLLSGVETLGGWIRVPHESTHSADEAFATDILGARAWVFRYGSGIRSILMAHFEMRPEVWADASGLERAVRTSQTGWDGWCASKGCVAVTRIGRCYVVLNSPGGSSRATFLEAIESVRMSP